MVAQYEWVLLFYRLPREPSTPRIALWRSLRGLGVVQLADGVVTLPADGRTTEALELACGWRHPMSTLCVTRNRVFPAAAAARGSRQALHGGGARQGLEQSDPGRRCRAVAAAPLDDEQ